MKVRLEKKFTFQAAHCLPEVPDTHKCKRLHGHSWTVELAVEGEVDPKAGWLVDYQVITSAWEPIHEQLEHHYLNDIEGLENATSENLAYWIWHKLKPSLPILSEVSIYETPTSCCRYRGE